MSDIFKEIILESTEIDLAKLRSSKDFIERQYP